MVKVKLIKATSEYDQMFLGGIYEAFEINYESGAKQYVINLGDSILWATAENCEIVETESCEVGEDLPFDDDWMDVIDKKIRESKDLSNILDKTEQLQAQLDCTNENYIKLNEKYMIANIALSEACKFIEEFTPGIVVGMEVLNDTPLHQLFWNKAEKLLKRGSNE